MLTCVLLSVTTSLNTSLHAHSQTLSLLSLQRSTSNLPRGFQLVTPGRILFKRGILLMLERGSSQPRQREFLLFSDCLLWLANKDVEKAWALNLNVTLGDWGIRRTASGEPSVSAPASQIDQRTRCQSDAATSMHTPSETEGENSVPMTPSRYTRLASRNVAWRSYHPPSNSGRLFRRSMNTSIGDDQKWVSKGKTGLVDLEALALILEKKQQSGGLRC